MVMAAEMTVAAGDLADVITIITHRNRKAQPVGLLQALRRQQDQQRGQRMQFSSVTLTYNSPKASRRRDAKAGENIEDGGGFNMVAVPDVNAAPVLKQMLDAVGLNQDSLTLRTSSASNVGTAFALAAEQPYRLQLPAPFTAMGPTVLTLEYDKKSVGSSAVLPADTLISTALAGASTGGLQLPGSASPVAVDLSAVKITTPTAIVGTQGGNSTPQQSAQVTAEVSGTVLSQVSLEGLSFLSFGPMNVSGKAGYEPMTLQELELSGALTAFGVAGTASFVSSGGGSGGDGVVVPMPDAQQADAGVSLLTYVPSVDLPLMAQSLGANLSLGVISANVKNMRAQFSPTSAPVVGRGRRARAAQDATGGVSLSVSGELQILGMSSYVSFDMSGEQGASIAATFVAGQINKVGWWGAYIRRLWDSRAVCCWCTQDVFMQRPCTSCQDMETPGHHVPGLCMKTSYIHQHYMRWKFPHTLPHCPSSIMPFCTLQLTYTHPLLHIHTYTSFVDCQPGYDAWTAVSCVGILANNAQHRSGRSGSSCISSSRRPGDPAEPADGCTGSTQKRTAAAGRCHWHTQQRQQAGKHHESAALLLF